MPPERPLRIAHFTLGRCNPDSANGVDKTVYHLARTQAALGHEVAVFSLTDRQPIPIPGVEVRTFPPIRLALPFLPDRLRDLLGARAPWNVPRRLVAELTAWHPDVLHLHFVHVPPNVFLARRLSPAVPYCVTIHGGLSPVAQRRNYRLKRLFRALFERTYLERAAFLHAISEEDVKGLEAYGVRNTTVLAPNGIDVGAMPATDEAPPRQPAPGLAGKRVFLFLGRLDPQQKGLDLLLRAFAAAGPPHAALVIVGPDWRGGLLHLQQLAGKLSMEKRVVFAGPAFGERKLELLRTCDVFVHPSRWEAGVPFSVLEAAALGRACLLTPAADTGGMLARNGGAVTVDATVDAIADAIRQMCAMPPDALRTMGDNARSVVAKEFSWPRTAGIIVAAYRRYAAGARE